MRTMPLKQLGLMAAGTMLLGLATFSATGQTLESYAGAMVRPPLEQQFGFSAPRWLQYRSERHDDGYEHGPRHGLRHPVVGETSIAPDFIEYNCAIERRPLEAAIGILRPFGTLKLLGAGPGCSLTTPLHILKPLRITGDRDALLMGPPGGPCLVVAPGTSLAIADVRLRSWSDGGNPCVAADNADVSLEHMSIETRGIALASTGGRISLRDLHLSGGPAPVLRMERSEFTLVRVGIETFGDGALIVAPASGIAQMDSVDFSAKGLLGIGLTLESGGMVGARAMLDKVSFDDFVRGMVIGPGARVVASHVHVGHAQDVGVEVTGSDLDMSNSVIEAGLVGVRLSGYLPGAHVDAPTIQNNDILVHGIAGIKVADGTPGMARNNSIGVQTGRCIAGFTRAGDFHEHANLCHPL
jgi:hypothetical protein